MSTELCCVETQSVFFTNFKGRFYKLSHMFLPVQVIYDLTVRWSHSQDMFTFFTNTLSEFITTSSMAPNKSQLEIQALKEPRVAAVNGRKKFQ